MGLIDKLTSVFSSSNEEGEKIEYRVSPYNGQILSSKDLQSWQKYNWDRAIPFELPEGVTLEKVAKKLGYIHNEYSKLYSVFINDIFVKDPSKVLKLTKVPEQQKELYATDIDGPVTFQTTSSTSASFITIDYGK